MVLQVGNIAWKDSIFCARSIACCLKGKLIAWCEIVVFLSSHIYILRSAEQTAGQEKRRQYTYDERIYIKGILYELFYLITKQI